MHLKITFVSAVVFVLCAASPHNGRAIDPTTTGQIGVNPVTAQPGSAYTSLVGAMTSYYNADDPTTKWIGVNSEYLTQTVTTTTINNAPVPTTRVAPIVFVTATAAAEGLAQGDVAMVMEPKLADALNSIAADVAAACPGKKRQACDPRVEFAHRAQAEIRPGGRLDFDFDWIEVPMITAGDVSAVLQSITGAPGILGALVFAYIVAQENRGNQPGPPKIAGANKIPATMTGPTKTKDPTSTSTSSCPPDAPTGADRPVCPAPDCKGPNDGPKDKERKCSEGQWKGCPCVREVTPIVHDIDRAWLDMQQSLLAQVVAHDNDPVEAWCMHAADPHSGRIPVGFCECGDDTKSLYFSEAPSTASPYDPCPYTTPPGPTITFQDPPKTTSTPPPAPQPKCNVNPCPDVAKAKGNSPWMHLGTATDSGKAFCHDNAGANVGPSGTASNPEHIYNDLSDHKNYDGSPAQFLIKAFADPPTKLNENDCNIAVSIVLNGCDTCTNDPKFGGTIAVNGLTILINPIKFIPCISC